MKNSKISGIILILVGIFIFLHNWNYNLFQWRWAWNIGILVFGIIIFLKAITDSRRQGLFWGSFLSLPRSHQRQPPTLPDCLSEE